jgi:hypothetical protein
MQISQFSPMASTIKDITMFALIDLGENTIGDLGCEFLSKANWPSMNHLDFSRN